MICSPIYGRITDHYKMSRYVVLVASLFSLIGHFTLITFRSEYGILLGKIGIGFGMSCDGLVSEIDKVAISEIVYRGLTLSCPILNTFGTSTVVDRFIFEPGYYINSYRNE